MICPIFNLGTIVKEPLNPFPEATCVTDKCAWWNVTYGMCCLAVPAYKQGYEEEQSERREEAKYRREHGE